MQYNLLWTGREYYSLENCLVEVTAAGTETTSTIIGLYKEQIYNVQYRIKTNQNWEANFLEIHCRHNGQTQLILEGNGSGKWMNNGERDEQFDGCIDVDIALTHFTNTLPIKRLHLNRGNSKEIQVIYFDLLQNQIKQVRQKYKCISETEYHYQNIPNDFEAIIQVDEFGFVTDYPSLFVRTAFTKSN